jgi:hypothetical protein
MIKNEDILPELLSLNEKNFNKPLEKYDLKHNSFFKNIEELNKAIDIYKKN